MEKTVYVRPPAKADAVECYDPKAETPAWISDGNVGLRVGRDGSAAHSGTSAFANRMLDVLRYDYGGEEKILPQPAPLPVAVQLDGTPILDQAKHYLQRVRLGELPDSVESRWSSPKGVIEVRTSIEHGGLFAWRLHIAGTTAKSVSFKIAIPSLTVNELVLRQGLVQLDSEGSPRFQFGGSGWVASEVAMTTAQDATVVTFRLRRDNITLECLPCGNSFNSNLLDREPIADIEIDGPVEDQQAIRSFLTYLRGSVPSNSETPVSPFNTSSQAYNGHVFWDADMWVFPALMLFAPERAKSIPNYRVAKAKAAERNFKERRSWVRNAPTSEAVAKVDALQYPWESSISGLEVSPTETKQQHHITGDVVWGLDLAASLGLADSEKVEAIGRKAARFYQFRSSTIELGMEKARKLPEPILARTILDTVSPDEHFFGDHDLYTNAIAEWTIRRFDPRDNGPAFSLPRDETSFLNYEGDRMKGYKQAAGVLAIYPLQNPSVEREARAMMDRFADKVSKNGPAMSDSLHALIWARLGEKEKAYETWRKSWMDFTNHPLMLFSEKRNKDATYFSTGAAGCLQTVLYGFLGIRIDNSAQTGSKWSIPLKGGKVLSIKPNLPTAWKKLRVTGLKILGKRYDVVVVGEDVSVTPNPIPM